MKVIIKAQSTSRAKKVGKIKVSINGNYHVINAVVFSKSQLNILMDAADKASIVKNKNV